MEMKGKRLRELNDGKLLFDLRFKMDLTKYLPLLNTMRDPTHLFSSLLSNAKLLVAKFKLWKKQFESNNEANFPIMQVQKLPQHMNKLENLENEWWIFPISHLFKQFIFKFFINMENTFHIVHRYNSKGIMIRISSLPLSLPFICFQNFMIAFLIDFIATGLMFH